MFKTKYIKFDLHYYRKNVILSRLSSYKFIYVKSLNELN